MVLDTTGISLTLPQVKIILNEYRFAENKTHEQLSDLIVMYESKWKRITYAISNPETRDVDKSALIEKRQRILTKYFIVKIFQEGVRP